ncbi:hypothetical protein BD289DRAFT_427553, partial [Coniella lustricola]
KKKKKKMGKDIFVHLLFLGVCVFFRMIPPISNLILPATSCRCLASCSIYLCLVVCFLYQWKGLFLAS